MNVIVAFELTVLSVFLRYFFTAYDIISLLQSIVFFLFCQKTKAFALYRCNHVTHREMGKIHNCQIFGEGRLVMQIVLRFVGVVTAFYLFLYLYLNPLSPLEERRQTGRMESIRIHIFFLRRIFETPFIFIKTV